MNRKFENFEEFMKYVDNELWDMAGVTSKDLPDSDFRLSFDDGESPRSAALVALKEVGW